MMTTVNTCLIEQIKPNWPAPANVNALCTSRNGGISTSPFHRLNLGAHVNDKPDDVLANRQLIHNEFKFKHNPLWLNQTHSTIVINSQSYESNIEADAIISTELNKPLVIMTADCLPILLANQQGTEIAAIHAGWKSLCNGIVNNTIEKMKSSPETILAWLGPCISQQHFEVGPEVKAAFEEIDQHAEKGFTYQAKTNKFHACLKTLAMNQLLALGVIQCWQDVNCTYQNETQFFSYRRDKITGRMGSFIWLSN